MLMSVKKHNRIVNMLDGEQVELVKKINELEKTVQEQFDLINEFYNFTEEELIDHQVNKILQSVANSGV